MDAQQKTLQTEGRALTSELEAISILIESRNPDVAIGETFEGLSAILPISEDYSHRPAQPGTRVCAVVVDPTPGSAIVSRTHPALPVQLLEGIIPEVTTGAVRIMGIARDPGHRTKISVAATAPDVDPVAACVGRGGKRVLRLVEMLGGERVEIIPWHPTLSDYLSAALAPGRVSKVKINKKKGEATVWTEPHLMAATVGEHGQNSLLAGRLTGLRVHVASTDDPEFASAQAPAKKSSPKKSSTKKSSKETGSPEGASQGPSDPASGTDAESLQTESTPAQ